MRLGSLKIFLILKKFTNYAPPLEGLGEVQIIKLKNQKILLYII